MMLGALIGGLGVFLLAIAMITDGLRLAAGDRLKVILERWTTTRLRGAASGVLVTAIVQSSSAVTVATIGFVNAGLLTLGQSLGVIYGANVGTTMTGWIVAAVGFDFDIEALALPMVGIGMFARMFRPRMRTGDLGAAIAGFGLFFIGIDLMKDAFASIAADLGIAALDSGMGFGTVGYVLIGILMTILTQSSSAAIAITLTAATGGILALDAAAAMVVGSNVGTTSTAALAVIGATANARRVAAAHVVFNLATGIVALLLLPIMLWIVAATGALLGLADVPAVTLALFHTTFNVLGVMLMWPFTSRLVAFLDSRFVTRAEELSRLQFLDSNVLATPALALEAVNRELSRAIDETRALVLSTLAASNDADRTWDYRRSGLESLCEAMASSVASLEMERLPDDLKGRMPRALRIIAYLEEVLSQLDDYREHRGNVEAISTAAVAQKLIEFIEDVREHISRCDPLREDFSPEEHDHEYRKLRQHWRELKSGLLEAASARSIPVSRLSLALEGLRSSVRVAEQLGKAAEHLFELARPQSGARDEDRPSAEPDAAESGGT